VRRARLEFLLEVGMIHGVSLVVCDVRKVIYYNRIMIIVCRGIGTEENRDPRKS
jgi:hypothetical protein